MIRFFGGQGIQKALLVIYIKFYIEFNIEKYISLYARNFQGPHQGAGGLN